MNELQIYCAATRLAVGDREHFIKMACVKNPELEERVHAMFDTKSGPVNHLPKPASQAVGKTVVTRNVKEALVVYFADTRILDEARITEIGAELNGLVQRCPGQKMVLNFNNVTFMSSALLSKIISFNKACSKAHIELHLCEIAPDIRKVFDLMKLNSVLHVHATEAKAIAAFEKHSFFSLRK